MGVSQGKNELDLGEKKVTKLMLGFPWYRGPDDNTFFLYFSLMSYFGALRERTLWRSRVGVEEFNKVLPSLPPLEESAKDDLAEPTEEDWDRLGELQIGLCNFSRTSLVGKAREGIVEAAQQWGADYVFFWDADMRFEASAFLRLWRHQKPVVAALAFTARHPVYPVIFSIKQVYDPLNGAQMKESSEPVLDYPVNKLITDEDVGGAIAFGAATMLLDMKIFRQIPRPWFNSTGCGEDWFFCHRCAEFGIPRYVDTSVKTEHLEHAPRWVNEEVYERSRVISHDEYEKVFPNMLIPRRAT